MQKDLLKKIDTLIEMSGSTGNIDTLKAECNEIEIEIDSKKKELEELKKTMQDDKYIKASDRIIDENIKISLELKLKKLEKDLISLEKEISIVLKEENNLHENGEFLQTKISKIKFLIETLEEKVVSVSDNTEIKEYYLDLIASNEQKLKNSEEELNANEISYQSVSEKLNSLTEKKAFLSENKRKETEKFQDTVDNLTSNAPYMDESLKLEDEKKKQELENKLKDLESRKNEILNDAAVIGNDAKEMLIEDDRTGCFTKIKELMTTVKKVPFMDIERYSQLEQVLKESEEKAIMERDTFAGIMETRKYDGNDSDIINNRVNHLENKIVECQEEKNQLLAKINRIDENKVRELSELINATNVVGETLKKEILEYRSVIDSDTDNSSPKKKASLIAAYNKKEEELKNILNVVVAYEQEIIELMKESKEIETIDITKINEKITLLENEKNNIDKKNMITNKTKDILAMEKDKVELKILSDKVKEIIRCEKYKETASELFDSIEMSLGAMDDVTLPIEETKPTDSNTSQTLLNDFRISNTFLEDANEWNRSEKNKNIVEENKEKSSNEFLNPEEDKFNNTINFSDSFEPLNIDPITTSSIDDLMNHETDNLKLEEPSFPETRLKVLNVEPLEENDKKVVEEPSPLKEDDIMVNDFKDDEYIDFDSLIGKGDFDEFTN